MSNAGVAVLLALMVTVASCTSADPVSPVDLSGSVIMEGQVRLTLTVTPEVIDPPGVVVATLTYENTGSQPVTLTSGYGCLSFASVYQGSLRIPFPATQYACTAMFSTRVLEAGHPIVIQWPLVIGGDKGMLVPSGTYRFVAELNTHRNNLEQTFVVR